MGLCIFAAALNPSIHILYSFSVPLKTTTGGGIRGFHTAVFLLLFIFIILVSFLSGYHLTAVLGTSSLKGVSNASVKVLGLVLGLGLALALVFG